MTDVRAAREELLIALLVERFGPVRPTPNPPPENHDTARGRLAPLAVERPRRPRPRRRTATTPRTTSPGGAA